MMELKTCGPAQAESLKHQGWRPQSHPWSPFIVWSLSHVRLFCSPVDCSLPGFSVHEIFQAEILEWFPISFIQLEPIRKSEPKAAHFPQHQFQGQKWPWGISKKQGIRWTEERGCPF